MYSSDESCPSGFTVFPEEFDDLEYAHRLSVRGCGHCPGPAFYKLYGPTRSQGDSERVFWEDAFRNGTDPYEWQDALV